MAIVRTNNLVKHYGRVEALRGVSLEVPPAQIFGLLGRNGAGKTTLVKILLGIVRPTAGDATLLDWPAGVASVRRRVGYLAEDHRFPDYHTGWSLLDFYAALVGMPRRQRHRKIPEMLELVGLGHRMHSKVRTYSKGMKQRLGVAQALLHDPDVLFLDEPTDGVDPVGRREIRQILLRLKDEGKTIFINSHLLGEVEMVSDQVAIMHLGEIVRQGNVEALTRQKDRYLIGLAPGDKFPAAELAALGYQVLGGQGSLPHEVVIADGQSIDAVVQFLVSRGCRLRYFMEKRQTLEDLFMSVVDVEAVEV